MQSCGMISALASASCRSAPGHFHSLSLRQPCDSQSIPCSGLAGGLQLAEQSSSAVADSIKFILGCCEYCLLLRADSTTPPHRLCQQLAGARHLRQRQMATGVARPSRPRYSGRPAAQMRYLWLWSRVQLSIRTAAPLP